jgi:hypothetical protein
MSRKRAVFLDLQGTLGGKGFCDILDFSFAITGLKKSLDRGVLIYLDLIYGLA